MDRHLQKNLSNLSNQNDLQKTQEENLGDEQEEEKKVNTFALTNSNPNQKTNQEQPYSEEEKKNTLERKKHIVWYSPEIENQENNFFVQKLGFVYYVIMVKNEKDALEYIKINSKEIDLFIVPGNAGKKLVDVLFQEIEHERIEIPTYQIMVFCFDIDLHRQWTENCPFVTYVTNSFDDLSEYIAKILDDEFLSKDQRIRKIIKRICIESTLIQRSQIEYELELDNLDKMIEEVNAFIEEGNCNFSQLAEYQKFKLLLPNRLEMGIEDYKAFVCQPNPTPIEMFLTDSLINYEMNNRIAESISYKPYKLYKDSTIQIAPFTHRLLQEIIHPINPKYKPFTTNTTLYLIKAITINEFFSIQNLFDLSEQLFWNEFFVGHPNKDAAMIARGSGNVIFSIVIQPKPEIEIYPIEIGKVVNADIMKFIASGTHHLSVKEKNLKEDATQEYIFPFGSRFNITKVLRHLEKNCLIEIDLEYCGTPYSADVVQTSLVANVNINYKKVEHKFEEMMVKSTIVKISSKAKNLLLNFLQERLCDKEDSLSFLQEMQEGHISAVPYITRRLLKNPYFGLCKLNSLQQLSGVMSINSEIDDFISYLTVEFQEIISDYCNYANCQTSDDFFRYKNITPDIVLYTGQTVSEKSIDSFEFLKQMDSPIYIEELFIACTDLNNLISPYNLVLEFHFSEECLANTKSLKPIMQGGFPPSRFDDLYFVPFGSKFEIASIEEKSNDNCTYTLIHLNFMSCEIECNKNDEVNNILSSYTDSLINEISKAKSKTCSLNKVKLEDVNLNKVLTKIAKIKSLDELEIRGSYVGDLSSSTLQEIVTKKNFNSIILENIHADDQQIRTILQKIEKNSELSAISLDKNYFSRESLEYIFERISSNESIYAVSLSENKFDDVSLTKLIQLIHNGIVGDLQLKNCCITPELIISSKFQQIIQSPSQIKRLILFRNPLKDQGTVILAKGLAKNRKLKNLYLGLCQIGDEGAAALAEALKTNKILQTLDLKKNLITNVGIISFAKGLEKNKSLKVLHLEKNYFDYESIMHLLKQKQSRAYQLGNNWNFAKEYLKDFIGPVEEESKTSEELFASYQQEITSIAENYKLFYNIEINPEIFKLCHPKVLEVFCTIGTYKIENVIPSPQQYFCHYKAEDSNMKYPVYEGFINKMTLQKEGLGILIDESGIIWEGVWSKDNLIGEARIIFFNSSYYIGSLKENKMDGFGNLKYIDNSKEYIGEFKLNKFHGEGKLFENGNLTQSGKFHMGEYQI